MNTIYNYTVNYAQNNKIASSITKKKIIIVRITPSLHLWVNANQNSLLLIEITTKHKLWGKKKSYINPKPQYAQRFPHSHSPRKTS